MVSICPARDCTPEGDGVHRQTPSGLMTPAEINYPEQEEPMEQITTTESSSQPASASATAGSRLADILRQMEDLGVLRGEAFRSDAGRLLALRQRLSEDRFHLAVLGHFKRGKSTLINALLGADLLPASVVPLTSVPTFLRAGKNLGARVVNLGGSVGEELSGASVEGCRRFLARFVTEESNPRNRLGVSFVEVFHPAPLLQQGAVIVDTPGIGSTYRHNTEATLNFLPQCDAAIFVLSADPPLTEVEVGFLKIVRAKVARLFFILNKVDYLGPEEQQTALRFLRTELREQAGLGSDLTIFCTSARQGLEARRTADAERWHQSGLAEVERHLTEFLMTDKSGTLMRALARRAADIVNDVILRLQLTMRSLQVPLSELEDRMQLFEQKLQEGERQRLTAVDLLEGDQKRLRAFVEEQAEQLRRKARVHLDHVLAASAGRSPDGRLDEAQAREQIAEAIPGFFEHAHGEMSAACRERLNTNLQAHQQRAHELVEVVRRAAATSFDLGYQPCSADELIAPPEAPYWVTRQWNTALATIPPAWVDRLLPSRIRRARSHRRLMEEAGTLLIRNVENLRWTTIQNLDETFRRFGASLDESLKQTIAATRAALNAARTQRTANAGAVDREIAALHSAADQLQRAQDDLLQISAAEVGERRNIQPATVAAVSR